MRASCLLVSVILLPGCVTNQRVHARAAEEVRRGYRYLEAGDLERAEVAFAHALQFNDDFPEALNGAGIVERQRGRAAAARDRFRQALRVAPDFAEALVNLGELELADGRFARAESLFRQALAVNPDLFPARLDLARTLLHRGRAEPRRRDELWRDARREYLHLLESRPGAADAHHDLGYMDYESGRFARAAESYQAAIASEPSRVDALHGACIALARAGRCDRAALACGRCLEIDAESPTCRKSLAGALDCATP